MLKNKPTGVTVLIALFTILGVLNILSGAAIFGLSGVFGGLGLILGSFIPVAGVALILIGLFQLVTAYGIYEAEPWSKIAAIIFAVLGILSFPIGTILSIIILIILFQPETQAYFK